MEAPGIIITISWDAQAIYDAEYARTDPDASPSDRHSTAIQHCITLVLEANLQWSTYRTLIEDAVRERTPVFTGNARQAFQFFTNDTSEIQAFGELEFFLGQLKIYGCYRPEPWIWKSLRYYAASLEYGSRPHYPPAGNITPWVDDQITQGQWTGDLASGVAQLQRSMARRGTPAFGMISAGMQAASVAPAEITLTRGRGPNLSAWHAAGTVHYLVERFG